MTSLWSSVFGGWWSTGAGGSDATTSVPAAAAVAVATAVVSREDITSAAAARPTQRMLLSEIKAFRGLKKVEVAVRPPEVDDWFQQLRARLRPVFIATHGEIAVDDDASESS